MMINEVGGSPQYPNNILQTGSQNGGIQQNSQNKRAENNKPQQNRAAESTPALKSNENQNKNFQQIAEQVLANRARQGESSFTPAAERGSIIDISV